MRVKDHEKALHFGPNLRCNLLALVLPTAVIAWLSGLGFREEHRGCQAPETVG